MNAILRLCDLSILHASSQWLFHLSIEISSHFCIHVCLNTYCANYGDSHTLKILRYKKLRTDLGISLLLKMWSLDEWLEGTEIYVYLKQLPFTLSLLKKHSCPTIRDSCTYYLGRFLHIAMYFLKLLKKFDVRELRIIGKKRWGSSFISVILTYFFVHGSL